MTNMIEKAGLAIGPALYDFVEREALPGSGIDPAAFWTGSRNWLTSWRR